MPVVVDEASGLKKVTLRSDKGATAEVFLHGAHVTSWKTSEGEELLFVSKQAVFKPPKAVRGGIPVCFPQFGGFGKLPQHGFCRNSEFTVLRAGSPSSVALVFKPNAEQLKQFPHDFELIVKVEVTDEALVQTLEVTNMGNTPMQITTALHTYFRVGDVSQVHVEGLRELKYLDNLRDKAEGHQGDEDPSFSGEIDRIYVATPSTLKVVDASQGRAISVEKWGLPDAVVWNPWAAKAAGMADFGDNEYQEMVCVEPALAASGPVTLEEGHVWSAKQMLSVSRL